MTTEVSKLDVVSLRSVWANEAADFTPWLAENLDRLTDAIGIEMRLVSQEEPVSLGNVGRRADIIAEVGEDSENPTVIVIENQLENADDDHFKRCFSYAAARDAKVIVWIVKDCSEEFRTIAEWFNDISLPDIRFYIVELKAVKIGDSKPAALFDVIVRPNETTKAERVKAASREKRSPEEKRDSFFQQAKNNKIPDDTLQAIRKLYDWLDKNNYGITCRESSFYPRFKKPIGSPFFVSTNGTLKMYDSCDTSPEIYQRLCDAAAKGVDASQGKQPAYVTTEKVDAIIAALDEFVNLFPKE